MVVAFRYMTRFACLGDRCEDTCCWHWTVSIDEAHYRGLESTLVAPADRARFVSAFDLVPVEKRRPQSGH